MPPGRRGTLPGSPRSRRHLLQSGQALDGPSRLVPLRWREVVALADPVQLPAEPPERAPTGGRLGAMGGDSVVDHRAVLRGDGGGHLADDGPLLKPGAGPSAPDRGLSTG